MLTSKPSIRTRRASGNGRAGSAAAGRGNRRRRKALIGAAAAAVVSVAALSPIGVPVAPASAAVVQQAATFTSALNCSSWVPAVAPNGAISAQFTITGGGGASGDGRSTAPGGNGGRGGTVSGTVSVQGGQRIWAVIGCGGNGWDAGSAKGWADGGDPGSANGGGGGGASALCIGTSIPQCAGGTLVAVAGGGGGGGGGTRNGSDGGTAHTGGAGGSVGTGANGSVGSGTSRGGDNGGNGNGGQNATGGGGANNTGGAGGGGTGARGNVAPGIAGGGSVTSNLTTLGTQGRGGRAYAVQDRSAGGGGGGYAGGGGGGSGQAQGSTDWNSGAGGGAGSSWARSTVSSLSFGQGATVRGCGASQFSRNAPNATDAGAGSNDNGGHGCSGWVTVTWTYENTATVPAVSSDMNTWSYSPTLDQGCGTQRTLALPTSADHVSVVATGGGGGGGGGGANSSYGGAGAPGSMVAVSGYDLPHTGNSLTYPNLNYQIGCAGGAGLSADPGPVSGGAGGTGFGNGAKGGDGPNGGNRTNSGGGGGGGTGVCVGSSGAACSAGHTIAVAGGGGGGGGKSINDSSRTAHGGANSSGVGNTTINSDAGNGGTSRGGYGGIRGRRGNGGGGAGGGTGGQNGSDNDSSVNGTAGAGNGNAGTGGWGRRTQGNPVAANGSGRNGGEGGVHTGGSTRRSGGGGGGGGYRGGGGGGSDEENGGSPGAGGGGSGSSWASTGSDATFFSDNNGGGGGGGGGFDANGGGGGQGGVQVTISGQAITPSAPTNRSNELGSSVGTVNPTTVSFQDPSGAATCGCTYTATGLPPGLSINSSTGAVTGTPTTVGTYSNISIKIVSSGSVYTTTTSTFTWTITPRPATQLAFSTQPGDGIEGSPLSVQPVVEIRDSVNAVVTSATSNVTLAINSGTGTLSCTGGNTKAAVAGVATFSGCTITGGTGAFTLVATSGALTQAISSTFQVVPANAAPVADPQTVDVPKQVETPFQLTGSDADDDPLTYEVVTPPTKGTVDCDTAGACTYESDPGESGTDSFTFRVNDGTVSSAPATVTINIVNNVPVAQSLEVDVEREVETPFQLLGTDDDGEDLTYVVQTQPTKGTLECDPDGSCTYTSDPGEIGDDSFTFTVTDGDDESSPATVTIHIANEAPIANAQDVGTDIDGDVVVTLTGSDPDGDSITFQPQSGATDHGTVSGAGSIVQYVPDTGFQGVDTFTFTVTDAAGAVSETATVTVYVGVSALRGTVTSDGGGAPIAGAEVRLVDNSDPLAADPALLATVVTDANGEYDFASGFPSFGAVPHGDYVVRYVDPSNDHLSEWFEDSPNRAGATNISLSSTSPITERDAGLAPGGRITGNVSSTGFGMPAIEGLQVRLVKIGTAGSRATTTGPGGAYKFELLTPGDYQLWFRDVSSGQWVSEWYDESATQANATPIAMSLGQQRTIDEQLDPVAPPEVPPTGTIDGTVTAANGGAPLAGIQVRLYAAPYTSSSATTTDANGNYSFPNKPAGDYKIWFRVVQGKQHLSEYNLDKPTLESADVVALNAPTLTVNASLASPPPAPSGVVSGRVLQEDGETPIAGIQVRLYSEPYATSKAMFTDGNGAYSFANLPAGSYKLWFRDVNSGQWVSEYHDDAASLASATPVAVGTGTTEIDARLAPTAASSPPVQGTITGTVTSTQGGAPISGLQVRLYAEGSSTGSSATYTDANGLFVFTGRLPGSYQLWFRDVSGTTWVSEWHSDRTTQASADAITVSDASPVVVDAALDPR